MHTQPFKTMFSADDISKQISKVGVFKKAILSNYLLTKKFFADIETTLLGIDAIKPVFGGLRTTQVQTSLRIRTV